MLGINTNMSKLQDYLTQNGIRQSVFAASVGTTQATISKLAADAIRPSLELAVAIERETGGAILASSWIPMPEAVPASAPSDPHKKDAA